MTNKTDIDPRFLPPEAWRANYYDNLETDHRIRYCYLLANNTPKANLVILPGLSEFGEKYIETATLFADNGFNVYIIDWAYQGLSSRLEKKPHKRHSDGFDSDVSDLEYLIQEINNHNIPLFMLAHSMGGNIGLRYLIKHPITFKAASMSAPMLGIQDLKYLTGLVKIILKSLTPFHDCYVPGGHDWKESNRSSDGKDIFSSDPDRDKLHNYWSLHNKALQVGNPTLKWVYESLKSINVIKANYHLIKTPVLLATAGQEKLVDNDAIKTASEKIENASLLNLEKAKHEIMMETDDIRNKFLQETLDLFNRSM